MFDPIGVAFFGVSYFYKYLIPSGYCISRSLTLNKAISLWKCFQGEGSTPWGRILCIIIFL